MEMSRIKNSISYLPVIGFLFLIASLPFYYGWFQRAALYILGVSYVIDYVINQRWKDWHWSKNKWVYVAFIGFFLLIPLRQCCDENITSLFSKTIQNYLPFLIFGICGIIGITNKLQEIIFNYTRKWHIKSVLCSCSCKNKQKFINKKGDFKLWHVEVLTEQEG